MSDIFSCPECGVRLRRSASLQAGLRVQCPQCRIQFPVPEAEPQPPPPPPSDDLPDLRFHDAPGHGEDDAEIDRTSFRREDDVPRPARQDDYQSPFRRRERDDDDDDDYPRILRRVGHPDDLTNDYVIDSMAWFAIAKQHWGKILGPAIGFQVVMMLINQAIGAVVGALGMFAQPLLLAPLEAGLVIVCLAQLQGRKWVFNDFFAGFKTYSPILLVALLKLGLMLAWMVPTGVFAVTLLIAYDGPDMVPSHLWFVLVGVSGLLTLPWLFCHLRLFFALPLILDRHFSAGEAIGSSWRLTRGHFLSLLGLHVQFIGLYVLGLLVCGVGVWFVMPYITLAATAGYLLVAGTDPPVSPHDDEYEPFRRDEDDWVNESRRAGRE